MMLVIFSTFWVERWASLLISLEKSRGLIVSVNVVMIILLCLIADPVLNSSLNMWLQVRSSMNSLICDNTEVITLKTDLSFKMYNIIFFFMLFWKFFLLLSKFSVIMQTLSCCSNAWYFWRWEWLIAIVFISINSIINLKKGKQTALTSKKVIVFLSFESLHVSSLISWTVGTKCYWL